MNRRTSRGAGRRAPRSERNVVRVEPMRVCLCSQEAICAALSVDADVTAAWFAAQNDTVFGEDDACGDGMRDARRTLVHRAHGQAPGLCQDAKA